MQNVSVQKNLLDRKLRDYLKKKVFHSASSDTINHIECKNMKNGHCKPTL